MKGNVSTYSVSTSCQLWIKADFPKFLLDFRLLDFFRSFWLSDFFVICDTRVKMSMEEDIIEVQEEEGQEEEKEEETVGEKEGDEENTEELAEGEPFEGDELE